MEWHAAAMCERIYSIINRIDCMVSFFAFKLIPSLLFFYLAGFNTT